MQSASDSVSEQQEALHRQDNRTKKKKKKKNDIERRPTKQHFVDLSTYLPERSRGKEEHVEGAI